MIKSDGIKGLYRGYGASVSSYAPASAVQWGSYELIKPYLYSTFNYLESQNIIPTNMALKDQLLYATSACCASVLAVIANHPFEIIRLRTQLLDSSSKSDSVIIRGGCSHLATTILKEEGWRGFYRALHVRLLLTVPSAVAALSGYDTIKNSSMV
jgi:solute carrier family 25 protein 44